MKFFPFFGGVPYILKIGFVMGDQITFVIQLCLLSLSVGGSGLWLRDTGYIPRRPEVFVAMDAQYACGLICAVLSLFSETSHLIGQHSAVQLRPPPYI